MIERGPAAQSCGAALAVFFAATAVGCRSEAPVDRAASETQAVSSPATAPPSEDGYAPPEWGRDAPAPELEGDEQPPAPPNDADTNDEFFNDLRPTSQPHLDRYDFTPALERMRDDANDSPESLLNRYPFFPFRAHALPAVSDDGRTVAIVAVKEGTIGQGAGFALDLYDVEHDRRRAHVVLWDYAEEDRLEDLNDSLGTAQAAAKRMDGRMSRANALLRSVTKGWFPLGKLATTTDEGNAEETVYYGIGLMVTVAKGVVHVVNMHTPALRAPP